MPLNVMYLAGALKVAIITKGESIPSYLERHPDISDLPKEHYNYIVGQGKKMLLAMKQGGK